MRIKLFYGLLMYLIINIFTLKIYAQSLGDVFTGIDSIVYEVTSIAPNEIKTVGYTGTSNELEIPAITIYTGPGGFEVTSIGEDSFNNKELV